MIVLFYKLLFSKSDCLLVLLYLQDDSRQLVSKFPAFQGPRQNIAVCTTPPPPTSTGTQSEPKNTVDIVTPYLNIKQMDFKMQKVC
jgi:hypothetical protein